jgi:motility quorum-sensing regulator/GCU-specific mRNA interferase toxin
MGIKRTPHHSLEGIKAKFSTVENLQITTVATLSADRMGFSLEDVVEAIQNLRSSDFRKSETAHSPVNHKNWHDTYVTRFRGLGIYLKFAGETLISVNVTSFKEYER